MMKRPMPPSDAPSARMAHTNWLQANIALHQRILKGEVPARKLYPRSPPDFDHMRKFAHPMEMLRFDYWATHPHPGNPLQMLACAAQVSLQKRRAAQQRAHERARTQGMPSPNQVHAEIERAIFENGSRHGAITYAALYFGKTQRQVHRLEQTWQKSTDAIARWQKQLIPSNTDSGNPTLPSPASSIPER